MSTFKKLGAKVKKFAKKAFGKDGPLSGYVAATLALVEAKVLGELNDPDTIPNLVKVLVAGGIPADVAKLAATAAVALAKDVFANAVAEIG